MSLEKVVFIDVDGVLNNGPWYVDLIYNSTKPGYPKYTYDKPLLQDKLAKLKEIVDKTGAEIVVSSSWRTSEKLMEALTRDLKSVSLEIAGVTPQSHEYRGKDIMMWLENHPKTKQFAILDDDYDMGEVTDHLVWTDFQEGLTRRETNDAIALLNGEPRFREAMIVRMEKDQIVETGLCSINRFTREVTDVKGIELHTYPEWNPEFYATWDMRPDIKRLTAWNPVIIMRESLQKPSYKKSFWLRLSQGTTELQP